MTVTVKGLLDEVTVRHGPQQLIARFLIAANREMRARGISLRLKRNLDELIAFNQRNQEHWYRLAPLFDPAFNEIREDEAYWIAGYDRSGDIVVVHAARFFDWTGTDLGVEFAGLRLWYKEPERWRRPGEICTITGPAAAIVTGRCAYLGSMWFRPDFRGRGLSRLLPRINRAIALAQWGIDFNFSFIEPFVVTTGLIEQYGFSRHAPGVAFRNGPKGDMDMHVMWMPRAELVADLSDWMSYEADGVVRMTEKPDTSRSPALPRHGSTRRS
jgi:GNAT superfamily N-acetyltransferase